MPRATPPQLPPTIAHRGVTIREIARACGVGKSTVSRALQGHDSVSEVTRAQILAMAETLGYDAARHDLARRLALKKSGVEVLNRTIAVFFPPRAFRGPFFAELYHGVLEEVQAAGFDMLTNSLTGRADERGAYQLSTFFRRGEVDGVISSIPGWDRHPLARELRETPGFGARPVLALLFDSPDGPLIRSDNEQGVYAVTRHLLELGHRHLCHFVYEYGTSPELERRLAGARRALAEYGLDAQAHLHTLPLYPNWLDPTGVRDYAQRSAALPESEQHSRERFLAYVQAHPEITAVIALNDANALHAWYTLSAAGYRIPEEMSIIGYDDTDPLIDQCGQNLLTSVRVPLYDIGCTAARLLIRHLTQQTPLPPETVLPTHLMLRASTAPPRG